MPQEAFACARLVIVSGCSASTSPLNQDRSACSRRSLVSGCVLCLVGRQRNYRQALSAHASHVCPAVA